MQILPPVKLLLIFIDESDQFGDPPIPLHEALMQTLFDSGIAGATANQGEMGFGVNRRLHKKGLFGITDDRSVTITAIENESKLRAILPRLKQMVPEGLIFMMDGEIVHHGLTDEASLPE